MEMKTKIYCDKNFFQAVSDKCISDNDSFGDIFGFFAQWPSSFAFAFGKEDYEHFIYTYPEELKKKLTVILKKYGDSRVSINFNNKVSFENNIDTANEVTLYFGNESLCDEAKKYGEVSVSSENCGFFKDLRFGGAIPIQQNTLLDWKEAFKRHMPSTACNSMIFVDNYIFKDKDYENLKSILSSLLPTSLSIEFHLTIVSLIDDSMGLNVQEEKIYENLCAWFRVHRPNLKYKLELLLVKKIDSHDRYIITNSYFVSCPAGFDILKKNCKASKYSCVDIDYPFIVVEQQEVDKKYLKYVNYISAIRKYFMVRGKESKNRLL